MKPEDVDVLIFTTVGTSLLTNNGYELKKFRQNEKQEEKVCKELTNKLSRKLIWNHIDLKNNPFPAETSSLYAFLQSNPYSEEELKDKYKKVVFIHSPDLSQKEVPRGINGPAVAQGLVDVTRHQFKNLEEEQRWDFENCREISQLDPEDANVFPRATESLFQIVQEQVNAHPEAEVFLNITGGYKGLVPYLTMLGMALGEMVRIFYLFEESPEIIWLPTLPMAFDVMQWRDQRGLLKPFEDPQCTILEPSQKQKLYEALQGTRAVSLLQKNDAQDIVLNPMGNFLKQLYDESKEGQLSSFGYGDQLLDNINDRDLREYLAKNCIPHWRHMSTGDHIPETVEHGRGHVQRLLELAQQFILAAGLELSDEQLFVLISCIWLHDLGHTGDYFQYEGSDGLVQNPEDESSTGKCFCYGDPDMVRVNHNLLTYQLIKDDELVPEDRRVIFPGRFPKKYHRQRLVDSVKYACLYHRRKMPVKGSKEVGAFMVSRGLSDFEQGNEVVEGFPMLAALLRVCDGAENQAERSGSHEYEKVMRWVIKRRVSAMLDMPEFTGALASLCNNRPELFDQGDYFASFQWDSELSTKIKDIQQVQWDGVTTHTGPAIEAEFKSRQPPHYQKHRMLSNTFVVPVKGDDCKKTGSQGLCAFQGSSKHPVIGVYCLANTGRDDSTGFEYNRQTVLDDIMVSLATEFEPVAHLLPFSLAIFLIENGQVYHLCHHEKHDDSCDGGRAGKYCLKSI
ncbi:CRISPR-associated protein APE2256 [Desulfonatronospira thiodismutans ASO3-1]|uniref:CRISPR-associated protein APE2256 n=1 Tax=Desulfonatronospira thiodismutans ASO3-1 TaxID=555779 RepID=D6SPT9_9BACT|nr:CRISPR-associated protein APE2256 [Desulfonatronospira thiodismutans]EFI34765.1 CRISPR-associated protein APE2256 [Desulfonatronospira thiodismutans ASO3-1]